MDIRKQNYFWESVILMLGGWPGQNIRLGLSSDVRGNLHTKFCFLCAKTVNLTRTIKLKKVEKEKEQTFYTLKFS